MAKKNKHTRGPIRKFRSITLRIAAVIILAPILVILLFRWAPLPTSAFILRQRLSGAAVDYRWVPMTRMSPHAALAVIASEDQNFFDHWGIDFKAISEAMEDNRRRNRPRGASTISQQVAKNLFLWPDATYLRKGLEVYFTGLIELLWSKERILEVYLNIAELGPGIFGQEAAAQRFFHKSASHLNRRQAATLAAVLPAPKKMSVSRPSEYVNHRTHEILEQMDLLGGSEFMRQRIKAFNPETAR